MLVDVYRALEAVGYKPSVRDVIALVRRRLKFRSAEAFELLKTFRDASGVQAGSENYARGKQSGSSPEASSRARKGITSYKESATQTSLLANGTAKKKSKSPLPGHLILDAVGPLVAPHLEGTMTLTTWRRHNANAAHAMAEAGIAPAAVADAWQAEYERTERAPIVLRYLHDRMVVIAASAPPVINYPSWREFVTEDAKEQNGQL